MRFLLVCYNKNKSKLILRLQSAFRMNGRLLYGMEAFVASSGQLFIKPCGWCAQSVPNPPELSGTEELRSCLCHHEWAAGPWRAGGGRSHVPRDRTATGHAKGTEGASLFRHELPPLQAGDTTPTAVCYRPLSQYVLLWLAYPLSCPSIYGPPTEPYSLGMYYLSSQHTHIYIYIHTYTHICTHTYTHIYTHMHTYTHAHTPHTYTYTNDTHMHMTHTHTPTHIRSDPCGYGSNT